MTLIELQQSFGVLQEMITELPTPKKERRNMFDIAGYPSWENVNSNLLAFYFDENEDHQFGRLFFDSLLSLLHNKGVRVPDAFMEDSYTVYREWGNIDILIQSDNDEWAIIIENRIYHHLHNNLKDYWNNVKTKNKIGIVLNLYGQRQEDLSKHAGENIVYHNILHRELVDEVRLKMHTVYEYSDDRHLLYLKDFVNNINQFYINKLMTPEMQNKLDVYQDNYELLDKLRATEGELHEYVSDCLFRALMKYNFLPGTNSLRVKSKHFYADENANIHHRGYEGFRIFVSIDDLLKYNSLILYFELFDEYTKYGQRIRSQVWKEGVKYGDVITHSNAGYEGGQYFHIAGIHGYGLDKEEGAGLYEKLANILGRNLFGNNGIVELATSLLKNELND